MSDRNWEKELAKIDRKVENVADAALFPSPRGVGPAEAARVAEQRRSTSTFGVFARLTLSVAAGVAMLFWPYSARCGLGLAGYLGASAVVALAGVWSAVWTFRHRAGRAHVLALLIVVWGAVLAAIQILPRAGYAIPTPAHPAAWTCG